MLLQLVNSGMGRIVSDSEASSWSSMASLALLPGMRNTNRPGNPMEDLALGGGREDPGEALPDNRSVCRLRPPAAAFDPTGREQGEE